jgi:4-phytase/acid phosphatase
VSKSLFTGVLLLCICAFAGKPAVSQAPSGPQTHNGDQLKLVVILSRHGVRSPTWTQDRLNSYSSQPWPTFSVAPGLLTSRGFTLVRQFASFDRQELAAKGLFSAAGCEAAASSYIWADTDQRTMETGRAFAEGLFPGCATPVHGLAEGENDPIFHATAGGVQPAEADRAFAQLSERVGKREDAHESELLHEMQQVLLGCAPKDDCAPAHPPQTPLLGTPAAVVRGKGDRIVDLQGPLPTASTLAEDFLLEYADGLPMNQVAWGHVDEAQLRRLLALHSDYFELIHRTPALAQLEASNMLSHIAHTLQQAVDRTAVTGAVGPVGTKLVVLAGHDTNLAGVASLLGVHWTLDGREDDTPPGTELSFELWQNAGGTYSVRVAVAMQTLHQLREMEPLTRGTPPAQEMLTLPACKTGLKSCPWDNFRAIADPDR